MKERIPLQIVDNRIILSTIIECKSLRIPKKPLLFVIDTGSNGSYLSQKDVMRLQIPLEGIVPYGNVDFGGSRFLRIELPKIDMYVFKDTKDHKKLIVQLSALKTSRVSSKNLQIAQTLPSILGVDFLREQKYSLHIIPTEELAYLECEA